MPHSILRQAPCPSTSTLRQPLRVVPFLPYWLFSSSTLSVIDRPGWEGPHPVAIINRPGFSRLAEWMFGKPLSHAGRIHPRRSAFAERAGWRECPHQDNACSLHLKGEEKCTRLSESTSTEIPNASSGHGRAQKKDRPLARSGHRPPPGQKPPSPASPRGSVRLRSNSSHASHQRQIRSPSASSHPAAAA